VLFGDAITDHHHTVSILEEEVFGLGANRRSVAASGNKQSYGEFHRKFPFLGSSGNLGPQHRGTRNRTRTLSSCVPAILFSCQ
jgi:hypothetical protein